MNDDLYKRIADEEPSMFKPEDEEPEPREPFSFTLLTLILLALVAMVFLLCDSLSRY